MNDTVVKRRNIINIIMSFLGISLLIFTIYLGIHDYLEEQKGITVYATIVSIESKGSSYTADVTYKVENKTFEQKSIPISTRSSLAIGDSIPIKYDLNNPSRLIHNNHIIILIATGLVSILLLILFLPKFISLIKRNSRVKKLIKKGVFVNATIQEVYINNIGKKNGEYFPYRLRCKYTNPTNNTTYVYDSEDCYINLTQVISTYNATQIKVFVDQQNSTNYFVDLESLIPNINIIDPRKLMEDEAKKIKAQKEAEVAALKAEAEAEVAKEEQKTEEQPAPAPAAPKEEAKVEPPPAKLEEKAEAPAPAAEPKPEQPAPTTEVKEEPKPAEPAPAPKTEAPKPAASAPEQKTTETK